MAITIPPTLAVTLAQSLVQPAMLNDLVEVSALNGNYLWAHHCPPLADVAFLTAADLTADARYEWGIEPSADGIEYTARIACMRDAAAADTIRCSFFEWSGGAWNSLGTADSASGTGIDRWNKTGMVIPPTSTRFRVDFHVQAGPGTHYTPHHVLLYPAPVGLAAGPKTSGFYPYDDGMLSTVGTPITTWHVGLGRNNALALLEDRQPMVFAIVQEAVGGVAWRYTATPAGTLVLGRVRVYLPGQSGDQVLGWHCRAEVVDVDLIDGAGATADLIRIQTVPSNGSGITPATLTLAADGGHNTGTLTVRIEGAGDEAHVDLDIVVKHTAGNGTDLRYLVGYWRPFA